MNPYPTEPLTGVTAADLAWLEGQWVGERNGDFLEEQWSGPAGGA